jgi:putative transcriptional regulator
VDFPCMISKEVFQKKLGAHIVKLREGKDMTQADLARLCDKDRQSIDKIERGLFNPSAYYLYQIANGLGVSVKEILNF